jgi:N-acetylmuramoyl-L-alanine amidase
LRLVRVADGGASVSFGIHEVRLGGPYLTELSPGTVLRVTGMRGGNYHVRLSPDLDGWVGSRDVEWAPAGTPMPHLSFTDLSVFGSEQADRVAIPYGSPVPFAVTPTVSPNGRAAIDIDFYGAHNAATWLSHRPTAKAVREVTIQQVGADHVRLRVELNSQQLWGYRCAVTNNAVVLTVRRPPKLAHFPNSPFKGLTIALDPGHGGDNTGAGGVSGSREKDVNRAAVAELARQFEAAGAKVFIARMDDESISLPERVRRGVGANADLWISVHANSAGHQRGYLSVSGTSTYYKWSFCRDLADAIHTRLLDITKLSDFGNVGNFNYYPLRANTWMPSMLVEQAFMSNPQDEAKMLDPAFRKKMMWAVVLGTKDWLIRMRAEREE